MKEQIIYQLITLPYSEIKQETFGGIIFTDEERGQILAMRYFKGNIFGIINYLGVAIQSLRTIIRPDTHDFLRDEASKKLDELETTFDEINQLLLLFPR